MTTLASATPVTFRRHLFGVLTAVMAATGLFVVITAMTVGDVREHGPVAILAVAGVAFFIMNGLASFVVFTAAWPFVRGLTDGGWGVSLALGLVTQALLFWVDRLGGTDTLAPAKLANGAAAAVVVGTVYWWMARTR